MISHVSDLSPPWLVLEYRIEEVLARPCILPGRIIKGGPKHTGVHVVREYLRHWFYTLGYLEFVQFKDGALQPPVTDPWWKRTESPLTSWFNPSQSDPISVPESRSSGRYSTAFGSRGIKLHLSEVLCYDTEDRPSPEFVQLPDPADLHLNNPPGYDSSQPAWPAPALCPDGAYARGQWVSLHLNDLKYDLADRLLAVALHLAQLPVCPQITSYYMTSFTDCGL